MGEARSERLAALLAAIPYARFLGMTAQLAGDEMTAILPFSAHLVGNTQLPALHGGVLGAFMEMTADSVEYGKAEHGRAPVGESSAS